MMHKGVRTIGGNMPGAMQQSVINLLDEFMNIVTEITKRRKLRTGFVRSLFSCSFTAIRGKIQLILICQRHFGTPSSVFVCLPDNVFKSESILTDARWDLGYEDPFLIIFPIELLNQEKAKRQDALRSIAFSHVESEYQRAIKMTSIIQINPLFGPASYSIDQRLAFVLMPFTDELTEIYNTFIKPTVENNNTGLICRRADDFKTNKAIIQDIWKAICEARVIIADLTSLNPNVMYELGIAHTVGKETIIIYQLKEGDEIKFPFDISHIRRIEYQNNAVGGDRLRRHLQDTLVSILRPNSIS